MNELVLTALINLFALFCTSSRLKRERAKDVLYNYLVRFFGIRNHQEYLDLYDTLCDFYELSAPDEQKIVSQVCDNLKDKITEETQALMVLRFMEFATQEGSTTSDQEHLFALVADKFGVKQELLADFADFVAARPSHNVGVRHMADIGGTLKVLRLAAFNKMVVSYDGSQQLYMNEVPMQPGIFMPWEKNGIIRCRHAQPIYYSFIERGMLRIVKRERDISFEGRDIEFRFANSNNGLHDFTFALQSGELVAIMGGSGTGKSTLISILNGSQRPDSGSVTINGEGLYDNLHSLKSIIGFVPQDDLLVAELTVYQNLIYTARFCFTDVSEEERDRRVNKILQDLDLASIKDLRVGSPLDKTISGGQRKRLNIALELIREPQILFLDEPTSGLSSADSEKVMHLLKSLTYMGKLVIACVHQPSSDIYKLFDRLWLLDRGGYPIYDGNPIEAVSYFKRAAGYADAETSVCDSCGNINTEIVLSIVDAKVLDSNGQYTDRRKVEPEEWHALMKQEKQAEQQAPKETRHNDKRQHEKATKSKAKPFLQFLIYLQRNIHTKLQDKQFLAIALLEAPLLAVVVAMLTRYSGDDGYTLYDNKNLLSYIFMAIIVAIFMGMNVSAEEIFKDRALLKRESFLQLSYASYICSKVVTMAGIALVQTLLFLLVGNMLMGIGCLFFEWWAVLFVSAFLAGMTGLLLSQRLRSLVAIYISIPLLLIPQILLCGVVVPFDDLNRHSTTRNVPWIGELIPSRWAFEAIAVTMFTDNDYSCQFFNNEQRQYELMMARVGYIKKMREVAEQEHLARLRHDEAFGSDLAMLRREVSLLAERWQLAPFDHIEQLTTEGYDEGTYTALTDWLAKADQKLYNRSYGYTRAIDRDKQNYMDEHGAKALVDLKYANLNRQLEQTLLGTAAEKMVSVERGVIVPQVGTVYLDPPQHNGRAPFYSSVKLVGDWRISTMTFNLLVLWLMSVVAMVVLLNGKKKGT